LLVKSAVFVAAAVLLNCCAGVGAADDLDTDDRGVEMKKIAYGGWKNNVCLENKQVRLVATLDVGPRIIHFGFKDGENVFKEYKDQLGKSGEKEWCIRGGHRLWHAPEIKPRTYFPDNAPVKSVPAGKNGVKLIPPPETDCGIQKEIEVRLAGSRNEVLLRHRLTNIGQWPVELAPWALTVMAQGGTEIIPLPPKKSHSVCLLPQQSLILWGYTDLSDPRLTLGRRCILLRQDANATKPTKIGISHDQGWVGYLLNGNLFVKRFERVEGAAYPDRGCNFETFTNEDMLEIESLGPLVTLEPGKTVEHVERWNLFHNVPEVKTEADVSRHVLPLVSKLLK